MRKIMILVLVFSTLLIRHAIQAQYLIGTADRFTNSLRDRPPKHNVYLVIGFDDEIRQYLFSQADSALFTVLDKDNQREELYIKQKELFSNRKTGFIEYYYDLGDNRDLEKLTPAEIYLSSLDGMSFTRVNLSAADIKKLVRLYTPPGPNASNKEKAKYFARTGNNQGNLMGANTDVVWRKRTKCSVKKRKYGKEGINGVREMTYGMH